MYIEFRKSQGTPFFPRFSIYKEPSCCSYLCYMTKKIAKYNFNTTVETKNKNCLFNLNFYTSKFTISLSDGSTYLRPIIREKYENIIFIVEEV